MKPTILVVDDEPDSIELIEFILQNAGFHVRTAVDGAEALAKARSLLPRLIVADVMLPEMDGFDICKILHRGFRSSYSRPFLATVRGVGYAFKMD